MTRAILLGPFLTRPVAARRAGLTEDAVVRRPDLLRVGGRTYREAYFDFQFGRAGIRRDIGTVVLALRGSLGDAAIADWLIHRNPSLTGNSPLSWMNQGGRASSVLDLIERTAWQPIETTVGRVTEPVESATAAGQDVGTRTVHRVGRARMTRTAGSH